MKYITIAELPSAILSYLERHNINQTQLGRELGVTPQNINNWIHGLSTPTLKRYELLLKKLEGEEE